MTTTRCGARSRERFDWLDSTSRHSHRSRRCSSGTLPDRDACLVLDVDLRGIGGMEFKRTIIDAGRDLPTIFITALEAEMVSEPLAALDPVAVLYKPFGNDELIAAIERACDAGRP